MIRSHILLFLPLGALLGCPPTPLPATDAPVEDTDTSDDPVVLPIDTSVFIPQDTGPDAIPDLVPDHWVFIFQQGSWALSGNPYSDVTGSMRIQEYVDELDTADANPFVCDVVYSLTGTSVGNNTCANCDFVMEVEHFVVSGDPGACRDPDTPTDGAVWQLGYDSGAATIYLNYFGTDVWLPWYDTTTAPPNVAFNWAATLAIEIEDTADGN